jgi:hypothetical protein
MRDIVDKCNDIFTDEIDTTTMDELSEETVDNTFSSLFQATGATDENDVTLEEDTTDATYEYIDKVAKRNKLTDSQANVGLGILGNCDKSSRQKTTAKKIMDNIGDNQAPD